MLGEGWGHGERKGVRKGKGHRKGMGWGHREGVGFRGRGGSVREE